MKLHELKPGMLFSIVFYLLSDWSNLRISEYVIGL